jgi:mono/diheme cytochrome c family protein
MSALRMTLTFTARALTIPLILAATALSSAPTLARGQQLSREGPIATAGAWVAPERAARQTNPLSADAVNKGRDVFQLECEKCHGKAGHGDGPQSAFLDSRPADLASETVRSQSDGALFWKITEGRGQMPKAKLSDKEKWAVILYLRLLPQKR